MIEHLHIAQIARIDAAHAIAAPDEDLFRIIHDDFIADLAHKNGKGEIFHGFDDIAERPPLRSP